MAMTPLDAEYLDGMISVNDMIRTASTGYLAKSDATSDPNVVDMARGVLQNIESMDSMFKQQRGHVDGDTLRRDNAEQEVEVSGY